MNIKLLGMDLQAEGKIQRDEWLEWVADHPKGLSIEYAGNKFLLLVRQVGVFWRGLLITIRDQKKFTELREVGEKLSVGVHELAPGSRMMDFNCFVLNGDGRGLYQYYFRSCAFGGMTTIFSDAHGILRKERIGKRAKELGGTDAAEKKARKEFKSSKLKIQQMIRKEDFKTLLAEMSKISAFEFKVSTFEVPQLHYRPVSGLVKRLTVRFSFVQGGTVAGLKRGVRELVDQFSPEGGKVEGCDAEGQPMALSVVTNFNRFGEFDFNEAIESMKFDIPNFHKSSMFSRMEAEIKGNSQFLPEE